jgi:hypothetical protein
MAVFYMTSGWTGILLQARTTSILEKMEEPKGWWE